MSKQQTEQEGQEQDRGADGEAPAIGEEQVEESESEHRPDVLLPPEDPPATGTWLEIDAEALEHNLYALRRYMGPGTHVCMVVKGNAYGHGYQTVVPIAEDAGIRDFAVFSAREAVGFLDASDGNSRLQIMGHADPDNLDWMCRNNMQPWINTYEEWQALQARLDELPEPLAIHVEIETGMNRSGLDPEQAKEVARAIHEHDNADLEGLCTHLAGAEDSRNTDRLTRQLATYHDVCGQLEEEGVTAKRKHIASSAAALLDRDCRLDMVRIGISSYGLWPSYEVRRRVKEDPDAPDLEPVLGWKSRLMAIKEVEDGDYVGYGKSYRAEGDTVVGLVSVGYADGFARSLSNQGYVLIGGKRATILGHVNMNMVQCHVSHIPDVAPGDEVVLVGNQGKEEITVASFSDFNNIVNYELMSRLSWEIPRRIVRNGEQ